MALKRDWKSGKNEHWSVARKERNRVGRLVEKARRDFFLEEEFNSRGDPKRFWKNISSAIPNSKSQCTSINLVDSQSNIKVDSSSIPNYINDFFANIDSRLASKFDGAQNPPLRRHPDAAEIDHVATDFEEVHLLCKEIDTAKSSAINLLSSKILKDAFLVLTLQLVYLFNLSLACKIFPPK